MGAIPLDQGALIAMLPWEAFPIKGRTTEADCQWLHGIGGQYRRIVEVGGGRSTFSLLAGNWARWRFEGRVWCVDCWPSKVVGTKDQFDMERKDLRRRWDFHLLCGHFHNLSVVELPSEQASKAFDPVPVVFLDGGTINMQRDVDAWLPKAKTLLCGHDCAEGYPEVVEYLSAKFRGELNRAGHGSSIWWVNL